MYYNRISLPQLLEKVQKHLHHLITKSVITFWAAMLVEDVTGITPEQLKSRSRRAERVTARILFTELCLTHGLRNKDICEYLERNKASVTHFTIQIYSREKFNKLFIRLQEQIKNQKQNIQMDQEQLKKMISEALSTVMEDLNANLSQLLEDAKNKQKQEAQEKKEDSTFFSKAVEEWVAQQKGAKGLSGKSLTWKAEEPAKNNNALSGKSV